MDVELRSVTVDEYPAFIRHMEAAFGSVPPDQTVDDWRPLFEQPRMLACVDGGRIVGTAGAHTVEMTLPGLVSAPVAGVTLVSVSATHRRRGLLTLMMRNQLDDVRDRGETIAILTASESIIYGRFGYGVSSWHRTIEADCDRSRFRRPAEDAGRLVLVDAAAAAKALPSLFEEARRRQPGDITRGQAYWDFYFKDRSNDDARDGASDRFYVAHESTGGTADGYATWRIKGHWDHGLARSTAVVGEVIAADLVVETVLWRFLFDIDLVHSVRVPRHPVGGTLPWLLADPRQVRTTQLSDDVWLRLVDLPSALETRRYPVEGRVVFDVTDDFCSWNEGRWILEAGPDGASCRRSRGKGADLALDVSALGSLYLGGVTATALARVGLVEERTGGALTRADAVLASSPEPFCRTPF